MSIDEVGAGKEEVGDAGRGDAGEGGASASAPMAAGTASAVAPVAPTTASAQASAPAQAPGAAAVLASGHAPVVERREHLRRPLHGHGLLAIHGHSPVEVRLTDIGAGGLGVVAELNLPSRTSGMVQFSLPVRADAMKTFECKIAVIQSVFSGDEDGFKVGLQFVGVMPDLKKAIAHYVG